MKKWIIGLIINCNQGYNAITTFKLKVKSQPQVISPGSICACMILWRQENYFQ